ncbi:MAG: AraC family transcriptional regulator [Pseudomonadota bacterium]
MDKILALIETLKTESLNPQGKTPLKNFGLIACDNSVHIRQIPFDEPCIIIVLSGRKLIFDTPGTMTCEVGTIITVPAPTCFSMRNEIDPRGHYYKALIIPFQDDDLERLRLAHRIEPAAERHEAGILKFEHDATLVEAVKHYLGSNGDPHLRDHRLLEILLILAKKNPRLLSYAFSGESWSRRVRTLLSADLARAWEIGEVCQRLGTSESALRRHLKGEKAGFRELLHELRLGTALTLLLQTSHPVYRIAYDCGYQSVPRFTSNFHKRFGLPPKALRTTVSETGKKLDVRGHPTAA